MNPAKFTLFRGKACRHDSLRCCGYSVALRSVLCNYSRPFAQSGCTSCASQAPASRNSLVPVKGPAQRMWVGLPPQFLPAWKWRSYFVNSSNEPLATPAELG